MLTDKEMLKIAERYLKRLGEFERGNVSKLVIYQINFINY